MKRFKAKDAIRATAKKRGVSEKEVRREIEKAIAQAWSDSSGKTAAMQREVPCAGEMPTPEELIAFVMEKIMQ
ncbi:MAG: hypothetical protein HFH28_01050 [Clostridiaceae bacterium]|nr:hypothetical protein [Clostridiaceae bacterium]